MSDDVYRRLAKKLDEMPNGYPATESGVELRILQKIFTPEEAETAIKLKIIPETAEVIAERLNVPLPEMQTKLDTMVHKGQIGSANIKGQQVYMNVPFIVGIFEFQLNHLDDELGSLIREYAPHLMPVLGGNAPSIMRVVPVNIQKKLQHEVKPYEDIMTMAEKAKSFQLMECICRKERALHGKPCTTSTQVCLGISNNEGAFDRYPMGEIITREKALEVLKNAEDEGLVHSTYNVQKGSMFICNCCSCCCGILNGMKNFNAPYLMAGSSYLAIIDQDECVQCGVCANERCPVGAIAEQDGSFMVQPERCIGCGVCTTTCPTDAISLIEKPESAADEPPANVVEWYFKRAENRGIRIIV